MLFILREQILFNTIYLYHWYLGRFFHQLSE